MKFLNFVLSNIPKLYPQSLIGWTDFEKYLPPQSREKNKKNNKGKVDWKWASQIIFPKQGILTIPVFYSKMFRGRSQYHTINWNIFYRLSIHKRIIFLW